jgi:hypothetical protein
VSSVSYTESLDNVSSEKIQRTIPIFGKISLEMSAHEINKPGNPFHADSKLACRHLSSIGSNNILGTVLDNLPIRLLNGHQDTVVNLLKIVYPMIEENPSWITFLCDPTKKRLKPQEWKI